MRKPPGEPTMTRFAGLVIMAMGVCLMALTGVCSAVVFVGILITEDFSGIATIGFGAVPALVISALLYYLGQFLRRW